MASSYCRVITMAASGHTSSHSPQKMQRDRSRSKVAGRLRPSGVCSPTMLMHCDGQMVAQSMQATHLVSPVSGSVSSACAPRNRG